MIKQKRKQMTDNSIYFIVTCCMLSSSMATTASLAAGWVLSLLAISSSSLVSAARTVSVLDDIIEDLEGSEYCVKHGRNIGTTIGRHQKCDISNPRWIEMW